MFHKDITEGLVVIWKGTELDGCCIMAKGVCTIYEVNNERGNIHQQYLTSAKHMSGVFYACI